MGSGIENSKDRIQKIMAVLGPLYPDRTPLLYFENPFQLLIATSLAAQCTDAAVNKVTPELFRRFPDPGALADAPLKELETLVHPLGFFHAKAHNIRAIAKQVNEKFLGKVPNTMDELLTLPGVGRKTASVILSVCYGENAIIVDTHFSRVTLRLGLTASQRPEVIEEDIAAIVPEDEWTAVSHVLNRFGRAQCNAKKPACSSCPVLDLCPALQYHPA